MTLENINRVATFWTAGDCEKAKVLDKAVFNQVLGVVIAKEQGREIEAEEHKREMERQARLRK